MSKDYEVSSGNVLADMGFQGSEQELLKAQLTLQLSKLIKARELTQAEAANLLGTTQPQVPVRFTRH
jgi:predicted XRE-type DNA-binding protein